MIRNWFNSREATEIGIALADQYALQRDSTAIPHGTKTAEGQPTDPLQDILDRAARELRTLRLNFYKRAKFANSFKWRLLEKGVERYSRQGYRKIGSARLPESNRLDARADGDFRTGRPASIKKCAFSPSPRE